MENILKVGEEDSRTSGLQNQMAVFISEADGLSKIEELQHHSNNDLYEKSIKMLETYFDVEDESEMGNIAPAMQGDQFGFGVDQQANAFDFSGGQ